MDNNAKSRYDTISGIYMLITLGMYIEISNHNIMDGVGLYEVYTTHMVDINDHDSKSHSR